MVNLFGVRATIKKPGFLSPELAPVTPYVCWKKGQGFQTQKGGCWEGKNKKIKQGNGTPAARDNYPAAAAAAAAICRHQNCFFHLPMWTEAQKFPGQQ